MKNIPKELKQKADSQRWFNAIDFGEFQSRGREEPGASYFNGSLFGVFDIIENICVKNCRCIDLGSGSGLVALGLKEMGAQYVAAADGILHPAFNTAREITKIDIDFRLVGIERVTEERDWHGSFDLVVSSGVMYHLLNPFQLLHAAKKLLKPRGLFLLQTYCRLTDPNSALFLNSDKNINGDPTTYFVPGVNAVRGLLKLAVFDIFAERILTDYRNFVTFLSRNVTDPDNIIGRSRNTIAIHDRLKLNPNYNFGGYDFSDFISTGIESKIEVSNLEKKRIINEKEFHCKFPYNPNRMINPVGVKYI